MILFLRVANSSEPTSYWTPKSVESWSKTCQKCPKASILHTLRLQERAVRPRTSKYLHKLGLKPMSAMGLGTQIRRKIRFLYPPRGPKLEDALPILSGLLLQAALVAPHEESTAVERVALLHLGPAVFKGQPLSQG